MIHASSLFRPEGGEAVLPGDAVAVDQLQPVALSHELVEGRLVLGRSEAVAGLPGRHSGELAEDGGVAVLYTIAIAAHHHWLVSLGHELVEGRLVLGGGEAVAGLPGRCACRLAPDRSIEILDAIEVAADPVEIGRAHV